VVFAAQFYVLGRVRGGTGDWPAVLREETVFWLAWAVLVPGVFGVARVRSLIGGPALRRVPAWLMLGLVAILCQSAISALVFRVLHWTGASPAGGGVSVPLLAAIWMRFVATLPFNLLVFVAVGLAFHVRLYRQENESRRLREAQLETRLVRAELSILEMQLHPHFFFNTLNTISALMERDVDGARRVLTKLGRLLRSSLDRLGAQEVSLREELAFLRDYLDIQQTRYGARLAVTIDVPDSVLELSVPRLLLQPIVENAIRYCVEPRSTPGHLSVSAATQDGRLVLRVSDDGPGPPSPLREGTGLGNTRARLAHLYGPDHRLLLTAAPGAGIGADVIIEVPARTQGSA
jgi:two-component system, LytTR family, sensor kinase